MNKRYSQLLFLLCLGTLISACNISSLDRIQRNETVLVGTVPFDAPFIYQKSKELVGPEVELARRITERLSQVITDPSGSVKIDFELVTRRKLNLVPALKNREIDMVVSAWGITEGRKENVMFSEPYHRSELALIINPTRRDLRPNRLTGARIGSREGTAVQEVVKNKFPDTTIVSFETLDDAILALKRFEVDGVIDDRHMAAYSLETLPGVSFLEIIPGSVGAFNCAVAVRQGDQAFLDVINEVITEIKAESQYARWLDEYNEGRLAKVELRHSVRLSEDRKRLGPRKIRIRISKDRRNSFDIYRLANLRFVFKNQQSGESYSTSRIRFRGRVGITSATVPIGDYLLSLPKFNLNAGTVSVETSDPEKIEFTIRLRADNSIELGKS